MMPCKNPKIQLREGRVNDGPAIKALYRLTVLANGISSYKEEEVRIWAEAFNIERWPNRLKTHFVRVAVTDKLVVGFAGLSITDAYVWTCYVHPKYNYLGIGRRLLASLERKAKASGISEIKLDASLNAVAFYERCGYQLLESVTKDFVGRPFDCQVMIKRLD